MLIAIYNILDRFLYVILSKFSKQRIRSKTKEARMEKPKRSSLNYTHLAAGRS